MELSKFAVQFQNSRGRYFDEPRSDFRSPFQRDRDRIIHSTAFRRLMHKTQVFVVHEGELFRTRLTHSLEVAQVARTLARRFRVDEDLSELIALSHDLGHPPFGHAGEDILAEKMHNYGGFDHNAQAIRIVSFREEKYAQFRGLNLTWESLEGIAKHNGPVREVPWAMEGLANIWDLELDSHASLEAQLAAIADDIAYNHHDVLDGLRAGLIFEEQFESVPLLREAFADTRRRYPNCTGKARRFEALSLVFGQMVNDVFDQTSRNLVELSPQSASDIRRANHTIAEFSPLFFEELRILRRFLFDNLYRHHDVLLMRKKAKDMLGTSFDYAMENSDILPEDWRAGVDILDETERARLICDYISGMTDRFLSQNWRFAHGQNWE